eukprot:CAMPEP_0114524852 /NCGR_PEP_ID=MMETSP0109-20121206/22086_1 /TAXON_ID=29199 /ORGANISM="Chlorarachnion reptans, Strain CCCM449" /LENGTH=263 /DNA_ID=CAMNT_0001706343 /DNA_START=438 /DNA_END=1229 /DNA_ORIENTATION=+
MSEGDPQISRDKNGGDPPTDGETTAEDDNTLKWAEAVNVYTVTTEIDSESITDLLSMVEVETDTDEEGGAKSKSESGSQSRSTSTNAEGILDLDTFDIDQEQRPASQECEDETFQSETESDQWNSDRVPVRDSGTRRDPCKPIMDTSTEQLEKKSCLIIDLDAYPIEASHKQGPNTKRETHFLPRNFTKRPRRKHRKQRGRTATKLTDREALRYVQQRILQGVDCSDLLYCESDNEREIVEKVRFTTHGCGSTCDVTPGCVIT